MRRATVVVLVVLAGWLVSAPVMAADVTASATPRYSNTCQRLAGASGEVRSQLDVIHQRLLDSIAAVGTTSAEVLADGKIYVGDVTDQPAAQSVTGAVAITNAGVVSFTRTDTLGGNPALGANVCKFFTTGLGFEGTTNDAFEGLLTPGDPTADRTWTLPDASGTVYVGGQTLTLANSETIDATVDASFRFSRNDAGTVTITSADDDATAAMTVDPGGSSTLTLGTSGDTVTVAATSGVTLSNTETVSNGLGRNDAGIVTVTAADNDATAALTVLPGGAAAMILGGASMTALTVTTDDTGDGSDVVLPAQSINTAEILNDTITLANVSDSSAVDADTTLTLASGVELILSASYTTGDAETLTIAVDQPDDGAATDDAVALAITLASESGDGGDTIKGITIVGAEGTANTIFDAAITIDNAETTVSTMTDGILITSSGVNTGVTDAIDVSATNIANAINIGANPIVTGNVAGTIGDATTDAWTVTTDGTGDAEVVLPENSVGPDEVAVAVDHVQLCGQQDENGTVFFGPNTAAFGGDGSDGSLGSAACDALDNAVEATADAPIFTNVAFKVLGFWCKQNGTLGAAETVVYTLRTAAGATVPSLTCTISEAEAECRTLTGSTTDIAAGATITMQATETSDNADVDDGWCRVAIALK